MPEAVKHESAHQPQPAATRDSAAAQTVAQEDGGIAQAIAHSPRQTLQRAMDQRIRRSAPMVAQRALIQALTGPGNTEEAPEEADASMSMASPQAQSSSSGGGGDDEAEQEDAAAAATRIASDDTETAAPPGGEEASTDAQGALDGVDGVDEVGNEQLLAEEDEALGAEEAGAQSPAVQGMGLPPPQRRLSAQRAQQQQRHTAPQASAVQRVKRRRSGRVALRDLIRARGQRGLRHARHAEVIRFVPGARPRTRLVPGVAAVGGGTALSCPVGSYERRVNNFRYRGSRVADAIALGGTPIGFVWHHHHDFRSTGPNAGRGSMILLRIAQHRPGHRGGVWQWNHSPAHFPYG